MRRALLALALMLAAAEPARAGLNEGLAAYARADWAAARAELEPLAAQGNRTALAYWGQMLLSGMGVPASPVEGARLVAQAAEAGDPVGENRYGMLLMKGEAGIKKDPALGLSYLFRAAKQDNSTALNNIGQIYLFGIDVPKDEALGLKYLRQAADKGNHFSWEAIGDAYWNGRGVAKDHAEAVRWFSRAADHGLPLSQTLYGLALWNGDGVAKDPAQAMTWWRKAADKGNAPAFFNLGTGYRTGQGGPKDMVEAFACLELAARLASAKDKPQFARARDELRKQVSPDQERAALARADEWHNGATRGKPGASQGQPQAQAQAPSPGPATTPPPPAAPGTAGQQVQRIIIITKPQPGAATPTPGATRPTRSSGTGIVVTPDGKVLTNSHVVNACRNIQVTYPDGKMEAASVVGRDADNDLALLDTPRHGADVARFRDGKALRSGDGVVVVGFPLSGLLSREPNVTAGVVSAMAGLKGDARFYQITAPVQQGNSGGPLSDMSGNVVGVVSSKLNAMSVAGRTGDIPQNVNFAIKMDVVRRFLDGNSVPVLGGPVGADQSAADVGERIKRVTVYVECEG
ncbi:MAG: trypsin-like peptidase domain-containing protein [Solirubrobacterales bacterium]